VLIHGFPLGAEQWRPQLENVPDGWQYIAPDLRGFGVDPALGGTAVTMDDYAGDVVGLLDELEIERAVIGGLSMGGYVTFALFRRAPERFSGVVLADTRSQADTPDGRQARRALSAVVEKDGASAVADQMLPKLLGPTTHEKRPAVVRDVRRLIEGTAAEGIQGALHALMTRPDSTPDLARIGTPTLVIVGEEDAITPVSDSEFLAQSIGRARLVKLPAAGHLSNLETPGGFSQALQDFLTSNL
jgi:pimeloyl-ACP methyl ester carboxylesterase